MSFHEEPIPADFFCAGSESYDGRINFEGVPLASYPEGAFGAVDTIVERLDDAFFDENGHAMSRLRVKAMHLQSRDEFENACGIWSVRAGLINEQPTTTITFDQIDELSGTFNAELVLSVRLTFTNVDNPEDVRMLDRTVHFTEFIDSPFGFKPNLENGPDMPGRVQGKRNAEVRQYMVDTDADGLPDSVMANITPIPSNWHYVNGWVCPTGVYPPDRRCVWWASLHQIPCHAHVTLPGAPPNPCPDEDVVFTDGDLTTRNTIVATPTLVESTETLEIVEAYPCPQVAVIDGMAISTLRGQFEQMEQDGRLIISTDELLLEILQKIEK